jgi:hypothetical protein
LRLEFDFQIQQDTMCADIKSGSNACMPGWQYDHVHADPPPVLARETAPEVL